MKQLLTRHALAFFLLLVPATGLCQYSLRGTVTDSVTREQLVGANVFLKGTAFGSVTDREGKFIITRIPAGTYTLRASYLGYRTGEIPVTLTDNDIAVNFRLVPEIIEGAEIVVTGQMRGQVAAINQQLTSQTIVNVISEEKIKELPDANAAEAIGRLPGVSVIRSGGEANKIVLRGLSEKYSSITVDGMRIASTDSTTRDVDLSMISQSSLAGIELYKALTPDKDADAIAGSVNLVTKKAPVERFIRLEAAGDYNRLDKTAEQYELAARYGERFFNNIFGVQVIGNLERKNRSNEQTKVDYTLAYKNQSDYAIENFTLNYTNEVRKRGGVSLLLDIDTPDSGSIRISNVYNKTTRNFVLYTRNYPVYGNDPVLYTARDREQEINSFNSSIRGMNHLFGIDADWALGFAQSRSEFPYDFQMELVEPSILTNGIPSAGMRGVEGTYFKGPLERFSQYALNNFNAAFLNWGFFNALKNMDKEKTASLDLSRDYAAGEALTGTLKLGGKYRYTNRFKQGSQLASPYYIDPFREWVQLADGSIVRKSSEFAGTRFANLILDNKKVIGTNFLDPIPARRNIFEKYDLYPLISDDALRLWYDLNKNGLNDSLGHGPEFSRNNEVDANYYDIIERISAGYVMNTLNFGQNITFIAGIRVEHEKNDYASKFSPGPLTGFPTPIGTVRDTSGSHSETIWLPNFHLTFRPFDFLNVRVAAYKALARPDFNHRINNFIARNSGGGSSGVVLFVGNPGLRNAQAWNYEVNTSFFSNTIGLVSVSAFYKDIKDMYHLLNGVQTQGQRMLDSLGIPWKAPFVSTVGYKLTYPVNSDMPTHVWGFEFEHQANLNFLPGLLHNIVLSYNLSIIRSETHVIQEYIRVDTVIVHDPDFGDTKKLVNTPVLKQSKQKLEGQPELFGNASIGYDIAGFSVRLSVFYQGEYNQIFSADGRSDRVVDKFTRWDVTAKQVITDNITVMFNLNNFTDSEEGTSIRNRIQDWYLTATSQRYGMSAILGLRLTL